MGVFIKNMKKPTWCYEMIDVEFEYCPFVNNDGNCILLPENDIWNDTWADMYSKCPLVEVPESHGDLIDRDTLVKEMTNGIRAGNLEEGYEKYQNINNMDDCVDCVSGADTVIEAEGE